MHIKEMLIAEDQAEAISGWAASHQADDRLLWWLHQQETKAGPL